MYIYTSTVQYKGALNWLEDEDWLGEVTQCGTGHQTANCTVTSSTYYCRLHTHHISLHVHVQTMIHRLYVYIHSLQNNYTTATPHRNPTATHSDTHTHWETLLLLSILLCLLFPIVKLFVYWSKRQAFSCCWHGCYTMLLCGEGDR